MSEELQSATMVEPETAVVPTSINDLKRKMKLTGEVKSLELYGAFIDIGIDVNALVHISRMGKDGVNRVSDALNVGDEVEVWVEKVDPERGQVMVTMVEPVGVEWADLSEGQTYTGTVKRLESFGAFVDIDAEREGLVHISELNHDYVKHPSEVVNVGDEVAVQVLGFSRRKRRIDLSMKALMDKPEGAAPDEATAADLRAYEEESIDEMPSAMELAMRKALDDSDSDLQASKKKKGKRKGRRRSKRQQQDDLLQRTLARQES